MKRPAESAAAGRVVLALEHLGLNAGAADLALRLAQGLGAELAGVLIEDLNLLRAAALPFTREVVAQAGEERNLDPQILDERLRQQARRLRLELERRALAEGVRTSFHTARGVGVRAALELRLAADLMVFGRHGRRDWGEAKAGPRIVAVDGSHPAAERVEAVVRRIGADLAEDAPPVVERVAWNGVEPLLQVLRARPPALLVAPAAAISAMDLEALLERVSCPVVLVV